MMSVVPPVAGTTGVLAGVSVAAAPTIQPEGLGAAQPDAGVQPLAVTGPAAAKATLGELIEGTFGQLRQGAGGFQAEDSEVLAGAAAKYLGRDASVYDHVLGPIERPTELLFPAHIKRRVPGNWGKNLLPCHFVGQALMPHQPWPWRLAVKEGKNSRLAQLVWHRLQGTSLRNKLEKYYSEVINQPGTTVGRLALSHQTDVPGQGWVWGMWGGSVFSAVALGALTLFATNNWIPGVLVSAGVFGLGAMASLGFTVRNRIKGAREFARLEARQIQAAEKIRRVIEDPHASLALLYKTPDLLVEFMRSSDTGISPVFEKTHKALVELSKTLRTEISDLETAIADPEIIAEAHGEDDPSLNIIARFTNALEKKQAQLQEIERLLAVFQNAIEKAPKLADALEAALSAKKKVVRALGLIDDANYAAQMEARKREQMVDAAKELLRGFGMLLTDAMVHGAAEHEASLTEGYRRPVTVRSSVLLESPVAQSDSQGAETGAKPASQTSSGPTRAQQAAVAQGNLQRG